MTDTNPEYEVDDRPTPSNRVIQPPNARPFPEQIGHTAAQNGHDRSREHQRQQPIDIGLLLDDSTHGFSD